MYDDTEIETFGMSWAMCKNLKTQRGSEYLTSSNT